MVPSLRASSARYRACPSLYRTLFCMVPGSASPLTARPASDTQRAGTGCAGRPRPPPRAPPASVRAASPKLGPGRSERAAATAAPRAASRGGDQPQSRFTARRFKEQSRRRNARSLPPRLAGPPPSRPPSGFGAGAAGSGGRQRALGTGTGRDGDGTGGRFVRCWRPAFLILSEKNLRKARVAARGVGNSVPRGARRMKAQKPSTFNPLFS